MKMGDVTCPDCNAGFRRIELSSRRGAPSEYRCPVCDAVIEVCDGSKEVVYRLTVIPTRFPGELLGAKSRARMVHHENTKVQP